MKYAKYTQNITSKTTSQDLARDRAIALLLLVLAVIVILMS